MQFLLRVRRQLECSPWAACGDLVAAAMVTLLLYIAVKLNFFTLYFTSTLSLKAQGTQILIRP